MPAFFAAQLSLGDTNPHRLADLLAALTIPFPYNNGCQIDIEADDNNSGSIFLGDSLITVTSTSRYGRQLAKNELWTSYDDCDNSVSTLDIYLLASAATQKANVILRRK